MRDPAERQNAAGLPPVMSGRPQTKRILIRQANQSPLCAACFQPKEAVSTRLQKKPAIRDLAFVAFRQQHREKVPSASSL